VRLCKETQPLDGQLFNTFQCSVLRCADDISELLQKRRFGVRKPPFYPLNYGDISDVGYQKSEISSRMIRCRSYGKMRFEQIAHDASSHQRNEPAAAADFELAEDGVEVLFHHRQTQAGVIGDLLITPPLADKSRNFLFAPGESDQMRQMGARRPGMRGSGRAQIFTLDKKMRLRHAA